MKNRRPEGVAATSVDDDGYGGRTRRMKSNFLNMGEPKKIGEAFRAQKFRDRVKDWNQAVIGTQGLPYLVDTHTRTQTVLTFSNFLKRH